jgi:hypothetical protein
MDLGYLLHNNPTRLQTEELCTITVLLEVDPIALVRGRRGAAGQLGQ